MSEISRDLFADKIANILHDITQDTFQLNVGRFDLIEYWGNHLHDIVKLYYLLNDNTSRETYVKLLRFNFAVTLLGERVKDKYALYNTKIWNKLTELANKIQDHVQDDYILDRIETFILEGYNYRDICCPNHGDVVFDCGAYTGNTALYFSKKVGSSGQVYAFEAMPNIYEILCNNISLDNVIKENFAVSNKSGILYFKYSAAGSCAIESTNGVEVKSIDEYVEKYNIDKVDFIKMDIEGAELSALEGCTETCRRFFPKLAICVYHKFDDFITIPNKIMSINENYKLYLTVTLGFRDSV